jgi:hypothetical protein
MIDVDTWTVDAFSSADTRGTLRISPEFQRRAVWTPKSEMLLIDSVARGVPIGALTLYADTSAGYTVYEVIDGKQRLTALMKYLGGSLTIRTSLISSAAMDDDEFDLSNDPVVQLFHDKTYGELDVAQRNAFLEYKIPVFVVRGERSGAIRSFTRMNQNSYSLRPQEIRNALFWDSQFLAASVAVTAELDAFTSDMAASSAFVRMGAVSAEAFKRMQDVQLASELLLLILQGPQHRRDQLDHFYDLYRAPSRDALRTLTEAREKVIQICAQIGEIFDNYSPLQAYHFPSACENDFYALVGALHDHGLLTVPQMSALREEMREVLAGFRGQVDEFVQKARTGAEISPEEYSPLVESYGRGFLGGQLNSRGRRAERIRIWRELIDGVAATLDPQATFNEIQRRLIWARSSDKTCARCGHTVSWNEYHAGHTLARSLGGRTHLDNGQIEHARCNQVAGATPATDT